MVVGTSPNSRNHMTPDRPSYGTIQSRTIDSTSMTTVAPAA